jgi:membrane-bound ClpP family serine protease
MTSQEQIDAVQVKDYRLALILCWTGFGLLLGGGAACFVIGIVNLAINLGTDNSFVGGLLLTIAGALMFILAMLFLGLAIASTHNYNKAKHHQPRTFFEDPIPSDTESHPKAH